MASNRFEDSRISEGTLKRRAQHDGSVARESRAVSRDDVRDGFAPPRRKPRTAGVKRAAPTVSAKRTG